LAGGVAHDFNNMLTVILGHSACLLQSLDREDPQRETVEAIERAARRSAALTSQLLAYSRKQILRPELLDVNALVVETHRMLRPLIGEDIELSVRLSARRSIVRADRTQIDQILLNLAVNSRDAMPGGGKLVVETRNVGVLGTAATAELPAGEYLVLSVNDTGCGMDQQTKSRIFEPFFTTKGLGKGTGLGLAMVYGIVKQSGGHIAVGSEPGAGTAFDIYLPVAGIDLEALGAGAPGAAVQSGHETVLLVEDEEAVRQLASQVLTAKGYLVLEAADGEQALRISREHPGPIDLLVADVVMPRTSGRQVAEALVADRRRMRVLYMSGYTDDAIIRHGVSASGLAFLQKPFTPQALSQKVREILDADATAGRITDREALSTIPPLDA
jgi:CheY-like chemotaxis protein